MKITIKKKNKIQALIQKALNYYLKQNGITEKDIVFFTERICQVVCETDERSFPELKLYWLLMTWLEKGVSEKLEKAMNTDFISKNAWHELVKSKFNVTSIAFHNMDQEAFHLYFEQCIEWVSSYIVKCRPDDLIAQIKEQ